MRAKHNKTLADLRLTLSIMIGALDPLFCLFPNLNEIMIAVVRVNSGSLERDTVTTYRLRLRVGPGPGVTVP